MLRQLMRQDRMAFRRSPIFGQELFKTIFLGLFALMMLLYAVGAGLLLPEVVEEFYPGIDVVVFAGRLLLYYFLIDILIRSMLQKFPVLDIKPLLARPINKSTLAHYVSIKSAKSFYNFFPWFFVLPFVIRMMVQGQDKVQMLGFTLIAAGFIYSANFIGFTLDKFFKAKTWLAALLVGIIFLTLYLDFSGRIGLGVYIDQIFSFLNSNILFALAPLALMAASYYFLQKMLIGYLYLDDFSAGKNAAEISTYSFGFAKWFGQPGHLMDLEAKLLWRSKRSKTFIMISGVMLLYPMIFFNNPAFEMMGMKIFIGLFVTGMFAMNYGQLLLSWNSPHFDLLLTRNLQIEDIFKAKYYLLVGSSVILFMLFSMYIFIDRELYFIGLIMFFYNIGVTIYLYMILASFNSKRIDPTKGAMMNYEGIGAAHFLIIIPVWLIPYGVWKVADLMGNGTVGFIILLVMGILGIVLHKPIIHAITSLFQNNKYKIAAAFRKKS